MTAAAPSPDASRSDRSSGNDAHGRSGASGDEPFGRSDGATRAGGRSGASGDECRRPIADEERPHLLAAGARIAELRKGAGLTQAVAAQAAELSGSHWSSVERGRRRTRRSTLERMATAMVGADVAPAVVAELVELLGPALAPESDFAARVERRRRRRMTRRDAEARRRLARDLRKVARVTGEAGLLDEAARLDAEAIEIVAEIEALPPDRLAVPDAMRELAELREAFVGRGARRRSLAETERMLRRMRELEDELATEAGDYRSSGEPS